MRKLVIFPVGLLLKPKGTAIDTDFADFISANKDKHWFVAVSNNTKPTWFDANVKNVVFQHCYFANSGVRQNGKIVQALLEANEKKLNLQKSQVVILGYGELDVPMYANSQSVLIRCDWRPDVHEKITPYGIPCPTIDLLPHIFKLLSEEHPWYFTHTDPFYDTYCLTNAATKKGNDEELKELAAKLQLCLKSGNPKLRGDFMVSLLSSFYATEVFRTAYYWTYFPSSSSKNDGSEIVSEFVEIARTTFKRRRKSHPLFIRHTGTTARHRAPQDNRNDPTEQIRTIHIHPDYRGSISGKTVVIVDDYMTYGVSFSVAAAFLKKAGAAKVIAVAIGKFPRLSSVQEIEILSDPFAPVQKFTIKRVAAQNGAIAPDASEAFKRKFQ